MRERKTLKELTIKDNFMFAAVMLDEENCRQFLEIVLGFSITKVVVSKEKSIVYHPAYKGVRLDIFANDENNTHYDVEMQVQNQDELGKRVRYYHSQIDMELLLSGKTYKELPKCFVIFICDFDPFGQRKYQYTFRTSCEEDNKINLNDESYSIFLSTKGENETEVSEELVRFMQFVEADLGESEADFGNVFIERLQKSVKKIKTNRSMEGSYMLLEELLSDERAEGKAEGKAEFVLELLHDLGTVSEELKRMIQEERDLTVLSEYLRIAIRVDSLSEFEKRVLKK